MEYYWDLEMEPYRRELAALGRPQGLALAMRVIEWTAERIAPIETTTARDWIAAAIAAGRESVAAGRERPGLSDELVAAFGDVQEDADAEPGVHGVLTALIACQEAPEGLVGEVVYGILDFCYQAVRDREDLPEWTPEAESRNRACAGTIAFEQRCVREALR